MSRRGKKPNKSRISIHPLPTDSRLSRSSIQRESRSRRILEQFEAMTSPILSVSASIAYRECQAADKRGLIKAASRAAHDHLTSETPRNTTLAWNELNLGIMLILFSLYATWLVAYTSDNILKTEELTEESAQILYTTMIFPEPMLPLAAQGHLMPNCQEKQR